MEGKVQHFKHLMRSLAAPPTLSGKHQTKQMGPKSSVPGRKGKKELISEVGPLHATELVSGPLLTWIMRLGYNLCW